MYTNNGIGNANGLSKNPHADRAVAKKRIISSSVLLGIGILIAYVGFILLLVGSSLNSLPRYDYAYDNEGYYYTEKTGPYYSYEKEYSNREHAFFYGSKGDYFYGYTHAGVLKYDYFDVNCNKYSYDLSTGFFIDEDTGHKYSAEAGGRDYSYGGHYYSYDNYGNSYYFSQSGYCVSDQGIYFYFSTNGDFDYYQDGYWYYNKSTDTYSDNNGNIYRYVSNNYYKCYTNGQSRNFMNPGKNNFVAPKDTVFYEASGSYYSFDSIGFYSCDPYGNYVKEYYIDQEYYTYPKRPDYYNYREYDSVLNAGIIMFFAGMALTALEIVLLIRAIRAFKASKLAIRYAEGYTLYGRQDAPVRQQRHMFCTHCGAKADADAVYCVNCGSKL